MTTVVTGGTNTKILSSGQSVIAAEANCLGGYVTNPAFAADQGLAYAEPLYLSITGTPSLFAQAGTLALQPGDSFPIPAGLSQPVMVVAESKGHVFTVIRLAEQPGAITYVSGSYPPITLTVMQSVIASYLYKQYDDDDTLQSFIAAHNGLAQNYLDTVNSLNLPVYTGENITGALLDWVAAGLYGFTRPTLSAGTLPLVGPLNTVWFNRLQLNATFFPQSREVQATSDDTFKRILTWHLYRGDGRNFNTRWLKRRIMRFLLGENGAAPNIEDTYQISVTFGADNEVAIRFISNRTLVLGGATIGQFGFNSAQFNELDSTVYPLSTLPYQEIFKEAVNTGALELPFQYTWTVITSQAIV